MKILVNSYYKTRLLVAFFRLFSEKSAEDTQKTPKISDFYNYLKTSKLTFNMQRSTFNVYKFNVEIL